MADNTNRYLLLLGCSKRKKSMPMSPTLALDRYDGPAFRLVRKWMSETKARSFLDIKVISAKYGLLDAEDNIPYYDEKMTSGRAVELEKTVSEQLKKLVQQNDYRGIYCDLGNAYLRVLPNDFIKSNELVKIAKGRVGERLRSLKTWLVSLPSE